MDVTLTTNNVIGIASCTLTIASIIWAVYERTQTANAREEVKRFRHLLLMQEISSQFSDVPECAQDLFTHVRGREWDKGAQSALQLSAALASLNGVQVDLIGDLNKQQLGTALEVLREINQHIPRNYVMIQSDLEGKLMEGCNLILLSVYAIERSLRVKAALGGDEDGK